MDIEIFLAISLVSILAHGLAAYVVVTYMTRNNPYGLMIDHPRDWGIFTLICTQIFCLCMAVAVAIP